MISRLTTRDLRVSPWTVPLLDPEEAKAGDEKLEPVPPEPLDADKKPQPDETDAVTEAAAQEAAMQAIRAHKAVEGHAEGLARGLEEGQSRGRAEGYMAGYEAGKRAAEEELAVVSGRLAKALDTLGGAIKALDGPIEDAVVALALELARRIIGAEVVRNREALVALVRRVVAEIPIDIGMPRILLHPDDLAALRKHMPDIAKGKIELIADEAIEPGGCRVIADGGENITRPDRRWIERSNLFEGDLTLASRWRAAMLALFD